MQSCIFCRIIEGKVNSHIVFEDDEIIAFKDISPQAPTHFLIVSQKHISTVNHLEQSDDRLIGKMFLVAKSLARKENIHESGYRLVMNCNGDGGQSVYHIHLHLLGGRRMRWPPG